MNKKDEALKLAQDLRALADRFSEGWHDGIKIDASDIVLLTDASEALAEQPAQQQEPVAWMDDYNECKCPDNEARCFSDKVFRMMQKHSTSLVKQQEPVAKVCHDLDGHIGWNPHLLQLPDEGTPLYTSPQPNKPWVGLTDEEWEQPVARVVEAYATKAPTIQAISGKEHQLRVGDFLYTSPQPAQQRHISYVCPQCYWSLEEQPAQPLTDESIKIMREMLEVQGQHGNWNYDSYMHGLYNGMEYMVALVEKREPQFRDAPETWLAKYEVKRNNFNNTEAAEAAHGITGEQK